MNLDFGAGVWITPFFPSFHFAAMCLGLLACIVLQRSSRWPLLLAAAATLFAVFVSDRLIVIYATGYMGAAVAVDFVLRKTWRQHVKPLAIFGAIAVIGLAVHDSLWSAVTNVTSLPSLSLREVYNMHEENKRSRVIVGFSVMGFCCMPWIIRVMRRRPQNQSAYVLIFGGVLGIWFIMLKATVETRYLVPAAYFILTAVLVLVLPYLRELRRIVWSLPLVAIGVFLLHKPAGELVGAVPQHPLSICLKEIQKTYQLKSGIGTYWNTHEVNFGGGGETPVRAFINKLDFHFWVNSRRFAHEPFNFLVARDRTYQLDLDFIKQIVLTSPWSKNARQRELIFMCYQQRKSPDFRLT